MSSRRPAAPSRITSMLRPRPLWSCCRKQSRRPARSIVQPCARRLTELDMMTFFGPIKFREDGMNASRALPLIQIQSGKPVLIYPNELSTTAMRLN